MPGRIPRSARVPHTEKRPERCPHCGSTAITRKGIRRKKIEIVQLWRCSSCKRVFTPTPAALRNKTFPLRIVLDAITLYDLGYSLEQTADKIRALHGHASAARPSPSGSTSIAHSPRTRGCDPKAGASFRRRKRSAR
jgi:transposase-like protein